MYLFSTVGIILWLAVIIVVVVGNWRVYEKAGQPGWACIIPIYSTLVLLKIVGKPWWWLFLMILPVFGAFSIVIVGPSIGMILLFISYISLVWIIWTLNMLSKSFGKSEGFTVGLVLLGCIFIPILGYGDAKYLGPFGDPVAFKAYQDQQNGFDFEKPQGTV
jgi:hypothetical protein